MTTLGPGDPVPAPDATWQAFGVDIGGSGVKGAPVDLDRGVLATSRMKIETPRPSRPEAVADVVRTIVTAFGWTGPVGITFPGVVKDGHTLTAANVDRAWVGLDADAMFEQVLGLDAHLVNDADAAGVAEIRYGAGSGVGGVVVMVTLGTGIGSALFVDGRLVPNTEFGHLEIGGRDAELLAAARVREERELSWRKYAGRVSRYLQHLDALVWPDLVIIGGGVSRRAAEWLHLVECRPPVVPAALTNDAGIVGAGLLVQR